MIQMRDSNEAQALTSHIHTLERTREELRSRLEYIDTTLEKCRLWLEESDDGQTGFTELVSNCSEIAGDSVSKSRNDSVDEGVLSDKESETSLSELKTQLEAYQQDQKVEQMYSVLNCKCYTLKDNGNVNTLVFVYT
uniref:Uncharacterized protein n=1 Tax=Biomphalaria glabrata TaxID=6526 RepID=A0A2C9LMR2_BIOGL